MGATSKHNGARLRAAVIGSASMLTGGMLAAVVLVCFLFLGHVASARAATDVMIVFDATGSMNEALGEAESQVSSVIDQINTRYADVHYAVADVRDYAGLYGHDGDAPWTLLQPMTSDRNAIAGAIGGLVAQGGGDSPEAYGRALYEADHDPAIGYRPGAKRLVVLVADDVPHDNDLNEGIDPSVQIQGSPFDTGVDPGPDGVIGTSDDIDWQSELAALKADGLPLYFVLFKGDTSLLPYWQTWAGITGGSASESSTGQLGGSLITAISAGASGCSRSFQRVGVVDVCADSITGSAAQGHVTLDGGVSVGDGPLDIDDAAKTVRSRGAVPLSIVRGSGSLPLGTLPIVLDGADPITIGGRDGLAPLKIDTTQLRFNVGGVPIEPSAEGDLAVGLDSRDGGGLALHASLKLPLPELDASVTKGDIGVYSGARFPFKLLVVLC